MKKLKLKPEYVNVTTGEKKKVYETGLNGELATQASPKGGGGTRELRCLLNIF